MKVTKCAARGEMLGFEVGESLAVGWDTRLCLAAEDSLGLELCLWARRCSGAP